MNYLIDTNVLLRFAVRTDPHYQIVSKAIKTLQDRDERLCTAPQNCIEFWNVATRPLSSNGLGLSEAETVQSLNRIELMFPLLAKKPEKYAQWRHLVVQYHVSGVQVHDAHLVAAMLVHDITHIFTFNTRDFTRYTPDGIVAVDPAALAESAA